MAVKLGPQLQSQSASCLFLVEGRSGLVSRARQYLSFRAQDALLQVEALQQGKLRHGKSRLGAFAAESIFTSFFLASGVGPKTPGAWAGRGRSYCQSQACRQRLAGLVGPESAHCLHQSQSAAREIHFRFAVFVTSHHLEAEFQADT